jgi:uncharacterized protein YecE (DUF72 family)
MGTVFIGISGWQYDVFEGRFYPEGMKKTEQLSFYARHFQTVEINSTFYHLPKKTTVENWREKVPEGFIFAIKASRYITHMKNLKAPDETLPKFFDRIEPFRDKRGPILFQLPPNWQMKSDRLKSFVKALPEGYRYTFELRNPSWFTPTVITLLRDHGIAACIYDFNRRQSPILQTADFDYIRLHGPGKAYNDPYDRDALGRWADRIAGWSEDGRDVFMYFDNTKRGYAWENARTLQVMVASSLSQ